MRRDIRKALSYGIIIGAAGLGLELLISFSFFYINEHFNESGPPAPILLSILITWMVVLIAILLLLPMATGIIAAILTVKAEPPALKSQGLQLGGISGMMAGLPPFFGLMGGLILGMAAQHLVAGTARWDANLAAVLTDLDDFKLYIPLVYNVIFSGGFGAAAGLQLTSRHVAAIRSKAMANDPREVMQ